LGYEDRTVEELAGDLVYSRVSGLVDVRRMSISHHRGLSRSALWAVRRCGGHYLQ
jgi:hypothetical protein